MESKIAEQILDELAPTFEAIETRSAALMQFLKEKGIASDEHLAPYLETAAAASSVRWRALRVRMGRLFAMAEKSEEEARKKSEAKTAKGALDEAQGADVKADAKKDKPDQKQRSLESKERAGTDGPSTDQASVAKISESAKSSNVKEAAQREPARSARSEDAGPREDEAPNVPAKKDAA